MSNDQSSAGTPRAAMPLAPLPRGSALFNEIAALLAAGIARVVEANAIKGAKQIDASAPCMELAIKRDSWLTVQRSDRECGGPREREHERAHT